MSFTNWESPKVEESMKTNNSLVIIYIIFHWKKQKFDKNFFWLSVGAEILNQE